MSLGNPFEAFLFRGRNSTNQSTVPVVVDVDSETDAEDVAVEGFDIRSEGREAPKGIVLHSTAYSVTFPDATLSQDDLLLGMAPGSPGVSAAKGPQLIAQLPWSAKLSNDRKEHIISSFEAQFCNFLIGNPDANAAFGPFVSSKYVSRHANADVRLEDPPTISHSHIRCQPGNALRDYQVDGVRFLLQNFHMGISSILADDMGLGKTAQICSFLQILNTLYGIKGPHLIVVPLSTITNWTRELARWAPSLTVLKYHGSKDFRNNCGFSSEHRHSVIITTPSTLVNDKDTMRARAWATVIVDEAHVLKNDSTSIVNVCSRMIAAMRISITGTPFQNTLGEMWTQMSFLFPYIASRRFDEAADGDDGSSVGLVKRLLGYIMLRRTKSSMDLGLPPRVDEPTMMIEPSPMQSRLLGEIKSCAENGDVYVMRRLFMELRKVCNHPMLLKLLSDPARKTIQRTPELSQGLARLHSAGISLTEEHLLLPSAKMIKLDHMLAQLKRDGHRVLIFSNFTSQLDILEGLCALRGYAFERLDGDCNRVERELSMLRFNNQASNAFVFLVTTTAGGVGVTLTGADTAIIFDCHFNPQMDRQAADRAHRIGQTRTVYVYRMCLKGTAEETIQSISLRKEAMGDLVLDGGSKRSGDQTVFSVDEIKKMLAIGMKEGESIALENVVLEQELISLVRDGKEEVEESVFDTTMRAQMDFTEFRTNICFACGETMRPLEPLHMCEFCPKGYHPGCLASPAKKTRWSCPRHACMGCDKNVANDGALFLCSSCPSAFCFDCLDPRYFSTLDASGLTLRDVSSSYYGMQAEGVAPKRSLYYITCLHCSGVESSSAASSSDSESSLAASNP